MIDPAGCLADLSGKDKVGEDEDGCSVAHKVGDRLHDVPAVLPPGEAGKEPKLKRHPSQTCPQHCGTERERERENKCILQIVVRLSCSTFLN